MVDVLGGLVIVNTDGTLRTVVETPVTPANPPTNIFMAVLIDPDSGEPYDLSGV